MKGIFMKTKILVLVFLVGAAVLFSGYEQGYAKRSNPAPSGTKIGVVSVKRIFNECKRNSRYR